MRKNTENYLNSVKSFIKQVMYGYRMALKFPESMDDCIYFTRRKDDKSKIIAWCAKVTCPKCKKGLMGKPKNPKTGRPKIRALEYACDACGYTEEKADHEKNLTISVQYTCPFCQNEGEATTQFKRKSWNGMKAYIFECGGCGKKIGITKRMKEKKGEKDDE